MPDSLRPLRQKGLWRRLTSADGLAGNQVEDLAEDGSGFLWLATSTGGLSRYDGDQFRTFTRRNGLGDNRVWSLYLDRNQTLWAGTETGLCRWDGEIFHLVDEGGPQGAVTALLEDSQGRLWTAGHGAGYFAGDTFYPVVDPDPSGLCRGLVPGPDGSMWLGCSQLLHWDGKSVQAYGMEQGLPPKPRYYAICPTAQAEFFWLGSREMGRFDGRGYQPLHPSRAPVNRIQTDRQGRTWFCTEGDGVFCFAEGDFIHFDPDAYPDLATVKAVRQDREGHFWFATSDAGVLFWDPHSIQVLTRQDGLPENQVHCLVKDKLDRLWMGFPRATSIGLLEDGALSLMGEEEGLFLEETRSIYQDKQGAIWLGDRLGLVRYDGTSFMRMGDLQGFSGIYVTALAEDSQGRLLVGHWSKDQRQVLLSRFTDDQFVPIWSGSPGRGSHITAIVPSRQGDLFFGLRSIDRTGPGDGLVRLRPDGNVSRYGRAEGLADDHIDDVLEDSQGSLWVGTASGLARFEADGLRPTVFTTAHGLPSDCIQCLWQDQGQHLWIGTEAGVARYDGQIFQPIISPYLCSTFAILQDRAGSFWFATASGLVHYRPGETPPLVQIQQVLADQIYSSHAVVELTAPIGQIGFEFKGVSHRTHPGHMLYTYRLHGWETDWHPPQNQQRVFYLDLPPGLYTFEVRALDRDLNVSESNSVTVKIAPDPQTAAFAAALNAATPKREFHGASPAVQKLRDCIAQNEPTNNALLLRGESGTGKGLVARLIHQLSQACNGPFVQLDCSTFSDESSRCTSELFGHRQGAFPEALQNRLGYIETAAGGTLFLDEIGALPASLQEQLALLLEHNLFTPLGGAARPSTARIIASTNRDLTAAVAEGQFHSQLYQLLAAQTIDVPSLRQRRPDIPLLSRYFAEHFAVRLNRPVPQIDPQSLAWLEQKDWLGNVVELKFVIRRAVLRCGNNLIQMADLEESPTSSEPDEFLELAEMEKRHIQQALEASNWVVFGERGAAKLLGVNPQTLRYRIRKYGLKKP
ncbi:MAG: AAA family ATPase [Candidatus Latescibacteria bacterium]|nr:AAA family ATPase [Candidatus Latescibacterota bacterium]